MARYAHPETLVETDWLAEHAKDPNVRVFEVDVDTSSYEQGHAAGAIGVNWRTDLQQQPVRDLLDKKQLEEFLSKNGVTKETTIVVYGDNNNWFAAWFFWLLKYYGHKDARLVNGGRAKWAAEGRPLVTEKPDGTGLGLSVAREIAQQHGGRIRWERRDGLTCFVVELPRS